MATSYRIEGLKGIMNYHNSSLQAAPTNIPDINTPGHVLVDSGGEVQEKKDQSRERVINQWFKTSILEAGGERISVIDRDLKIVWVYPGIEKWAGRLEDIHKNKFL